MFNNIDRKIVLREIIRLVTFVGIFAFLSKIFVAPEKAMSQHIRSGLIIFLITDYSVEFSRKIRKKDENKER